MTLEKALTKAEKAAAKHPDAATWDAAGRAAYNLAEAYYVNNTTAAGSGFEKQGFPVLAKLKVAWNHYLAVLPASPDQGLAADVASAFGAAPTGIQLWATAEAAQEIVATGAPTFSEYYTLAYDAYNAREISQGDLAGARAVALAPKSEKTENEGGAGALQGGGHRLDRRDRGHRHDEHDLDHRHLEQHDDVEQHHELEHDVEQHDDIHELEEQLRRARRPTGRSGAGARSPITSTGLPAVAGEISGR